MKVVRFQWLFVATLEIWDSAKKEHCIVHSLIYHAVMFTEIKDLIPV